MCIRDRINTKHDTIFKAPNIENTQNTNTYATITHNNTTLNDQRPTRNLNGIQQTHKYLSLIHILFYSSSYSKVQQFICYKIENWPCELTYNVDNFNVILKKCNKLYSCSRKSHLTSSYSSDKY